MQSNEKRLHKLTTETLSNRPGLGRVSSLGPRHKRALILAQCSGNARFRFMRRRMDRRNSPLDGIVSPNLP